MPTRSYIEVINAELPDAPRFVCVSMDRPLLSKLRSLSKVCAANSLIETRVWCAPYGLSLNWENRNKPQVGHGEIDSGILMSEHSVSFFGVLPNRDGTQIQTVNVPLDWLEYLVARDQETAFFGYLQPNGTPSSAFDSVSDKALDSAVIPCTPRPKC